MSRFKLTVWYELNVGEDEKQSDVFGLIDRVIKDGVRGIGMTEEHYEGSAYNVMRAVPLGSKLSWESKNER